MIVTSIRFVIISIITFSIVPYRHTLVLGATIQYANPILNSQDGCVLTLPPNRAFSPVVTDQETRLELKPVFDQRSGIWYLRIEKDRKIKANCGKGNKLSNHEYYHYLLLTCIGGTQFQDNDEESVSLVDAIECSNPRQVAPNVHRNGLCFGNATNFDIEFVNESPTRKYYSVCMDEGISASLHSSSYIDGESMANEGSESTGNRPDFRGHEFYPFPIKEAYKWENAFEHLSELLGSEDLVNEYFPNPQYRFSRGHLFPNGDALKRFEKHATFFYINTVPQWQNLNGGNWAVIEQAVRTLAITLSRTLKVTTGAFGVTTLKDANNNDVELWLARDDTGKQRLPVPQFVWKVVQDSVGDSAIAFVQVNNPWIQNHNEICNDVCNELGWFKTSELHNVKKGYTYCCDVRELRQVIPYVPDVKYSRRLGAGVDINDSIDSGNDSGFESSSSSDSEYESSDTGDDSSNERDDDSED